jgi:hypothetical protein
MLQLRQQLFDLSDWLLFGPTIEGKANANHHAGKP